MYMHNLTITETERKTLKNAWLRYFNDQLFEEGLITEEEKNHVAGKITEQTTQHG